MSDAYEHAETRIAAAENVAVRINGTRLLARIDEFARIGALPGGGVDRQALTIGDRLARSEMARIARDRGFIVEQDAAANLFLRSARTPTRPDLPPFLIGSHLDTQPTGGRFDGALGVLTALEVLETLEDAGAALDAPLELVVWTNEEGCRFAPGSMGSQAFVNRALPEGLDARLGVDGASLGRELAATLDALPEVPMRALGGDISGYLELHIEQGPILEREELPIGVVSGVQGTRWLRVRVTGESGHAGTTPLSARRDAMAAAVLGLARRYASVMPNDPDARMTVGRIAAEPGSVNAIPAAATFTIDLRHPDLQEMDRLEAYIIETLSHAATEGGCSVKVERIFDMAPALFAKGLQAAVAKAADDQQIKHRPITSGAFHDALFLNRIAPAAMIFVPCRDGISHNEREFVAPEHAITGANVLLGAVKTALTALACQRPGDVRAASPA